MRNIDDWIDRRLAEIGKKLPGLVSTNPASFECGYQCGYKTALLDLERIICDGLKLRESLCWCGDRYHPPGGVCL